MVRLPPNPCMKCKQRHPGCHSICEDFREWEKVKEAEKNKARSAYYVDVIMNSYKSASRRKAERDKKNNHKASNTSLRNLSNKEIGIVDPNIDPKNDS